MSDDRPPTGTPEPRNTAVDPTVTKEETDEEIDLTGGKTLSDFLSDEPPAPKSETPDYRAVPNVGRYVMPPPPGLAASTTDKPPAQSKPQTGTRPATPPGPASAKPSARSAEESEESGTEQSSDDETGPSAANAAPGEGGGPADVPAPSSRPARPARPVIGGGDDDGEFGRMLDGSTEARSFEEGQTVKARIVAIGGDVAFVDIGAKSEIAIDISELKDNEGDLEFEVGDTIEATVVQGGDGPKLSRKLARGAAAKAQIGDAFRAGVPVEGRVEKAIKGGYEVRVAGERAFCPSSQIDRVRTADPAAHLGQHYTFRIIEYKDGGKNLVVSRRALLDEEDKTRAEETRKAIQPGAILTGKVVSVREYGAFVDLGGIQGLVHVSEMGWSRVTNPAEIVKPGDTVSVKVLKIDDAKGRISLGLKQLQDDPWSKAAEKFTVGQVYPGTVMRVQEFGAFVELEPGVEGLAHVSTFAPTGTADGWKKSAPPGTAGRFEVLTVDPARKRIGVAMLEEGETRHTRAPEPRGERPADAEAGAASSRERAAGTASPRERAASSAPARNPVTPGSRIKGKVERHEKFGVFVYLAPGRTGLMPAAESGVGRGTDLRKAFPVGSELEVAVLEVDPTGRRIRLSRKALIDAEERDDARGYTERTTSKPTEGFGSIGDKLRAALSTKKS